MKTTTIETARRAVLRALAKGPCTGETLRDDLAARCGSKENVGRGISELRRTGHITDAGREGKSIVWELTDAGRGAVPAEPERKAAA